MAIEDAEAEDVEAGRSAIQLQSKAKNALNMHVNPRCSSIWASYLLSLASVAFLGADLCERAAFLSGLLPIRSRKPVQLDSTVPAHAFRMPSVLMRAWPAEVHLRRTRSTTFSLHPRSGVCCPPGYHKIASDMSTFPPARLRHVDHVRPV